MMGTKCDNDTNPSPTHKLKNPMFIACKCLMKNDVEQLILN